MHVLFADDHALFREGLKYLLPRAVGEDVSIREVASYAETLAALRDGAAPDLVLLDLRMPDMGGLDSVRSVCEAAHPAPVVVCSGAYAQADIFPVLEAGAAGFIPKTLSAESMVNAVRLVLSGERYIPAAAYWGDDGADVGAPALTDNGAAPGFDRLTEREREVLAALVDGLSNKEIARRLDLKEVTVRAHLKSIFHKLEVTSRTRAVSEALRGGFRG